MSSIEIRITAKNISAHKRNVDESQGYFIDAFSPINAAGILSRLRDISAIKAYILEHSIPADPDSLPTIISPLNDQGEFSISLPSPGNTSQVFAIRIIA